MGSHAQFLQLQGEDTADVNGIATLQLEKTKLDAREKALLEYVKVLTLEPYKMRDTHVARLRTAGWKDDEIFEASFITALFAFFNRMADAYGLDYPQGGWLPPGALTPGGNPAR